MEGTQPRHPPMQLTSQIVQEIDRDYAPSISCPDSDRTSRSCAITQATRGLQTVQ